MFFDYYTTTESAHYLGISRTTFYRWLEDGKIPPAAKNLNVLSLWHKEQLDLVKKSQDTQFQPFSEDTDMFKLKTTTKKPAAKKPVAKKPAAKKPAAKKSPVKKPVAKKKK